MRPPAGWRSSPQQRRKPPQTPSTPVTAASPTPSDPPAQAPPSSIAPKASPPLRRATPYRAAPLSPTRRAIVSDEVGPLALSPEPRTPAPRALRPLGGPTPADPTAGSAVGTRTGAGTAPAGGAADAARPGDRNAPQKATGPDEEAEAPSAHSRDEARRAQRAGRLAAVVLLMLIGMRRDLVGSVAIGDLAALAAIPVTWSAVRRERRFSPLLLLGTLAAATGVLLSWAAGPTFHVSGSLQRAMTMSLLALPWATAAFTWGAHRLGASRAAAALATGMLINALPLLASNDNPWKFGIGTPVTLMVLALLNPCGRQLQLVALTALAAVFMLNDTRLLPAFLAIIGATVLWQATASWFRWRLPAPRSVALIQALVLGTIGAVAVAAILAASASGTLGADAQDRTLTQSHGESNFLLNARPELGASWALLKHRPWGYGTGVLPRYEDIQVAKTGMEALGYDPSNGYVENFMFGNGFELHSALMNVWVAASLPGAALLLLITCLTLTALLRDLGRLRITPWMLLAGMVVLQNIFVGPWSVLPPYLPFILGPWILLPGLREQNRSAQARQRPAQEGGAAGA